MYVSLDSESRRETFGIRNLDNNEIYLSLAVTDFENFGPSNLLQNKYFQFASCASSKIRILG